MKPPFPYVDRANRNKPGSDDHVGLRALMAASLLLLLAACSTGGLIVGAAGAAGSYAVNDKRGALIGGIGGAILGDQLLR